MDTEGVDHVLPCHWHVFDPVGQRGSLSTGHVDDWECARKWRETAETGMSVDERARMRIWKSLRLFLRT